MKHFLVMEIYRFWILLMLNWSWLLLSLLPVCRATEVSRKKKQAEKKQTGSKILVRNVPFQATVREIRELFWYTHTQRHHYYFIHTMWRKFGARSFNNTRISLCLLSTFGELKTVRLPKKAAGTGNHRGFGFIDFLTKQDAKVCVLWEF